MDGVFFLKAGVPSGLPPSVKGVELDPTSYGFACEGSDKLCSTAYSQLWQHLGGSAGGVVAKLKKKYGIDGRVAFVSFSAGHGFMAPLLNNDRDRADTSAVILLDSTFGGGKDGYVKAARAAAEGRMLLVTTTSNTGGDKDWKSYVWDPVVQSGVHPEVASAVPPMPQPSGGVYRAGDLWYYKFVDAKGNTELPHWEMSKVLNAVLVAHLFAYWGGEKPRDWLWWGLGLGAAALGGLWLWKNRSSLAVKGDLLG